MLDLVTKEQQLHAARLANDEAEAICLVLLSQVSKRCAAQLWVAKEAA